MGDHEHAGGPIGVVAADWLHGRLRRGTGRVVGAGPRAAYIEVQSQDHATSGGTWTLAIEDHRGVGLPCGVRLPAAHAAVLGQVRPGMGVTIAGDVVTLATEPPTRLQVLRWHRCRPAVVAPDPVDLGARLAVLLGPRTAHRMVRRGPWWQWRWPDLDPVLGRGVSDLIEVATTPATGDPQLVVDRLVGHGPGSTPSGDDLLAGFVATGVALDGPLRPTVAVLSEFMLRDARARTTSLSATLLVCAADGAMAVPAAGFLQVLLADTTSPDRVRAAFDHLARIGHTSGRDLALGIVGAVHAHLATTVGAGPRRG